MPQKLSSALKILMTLTGLSIICVMVAASLWLGEVEREKASHITQGKPIEYEPDNHNKVKYEYFVAGQRYVGEASSGNDYKLGVSYPVYFDPNNPSLSFLGTLPHNLQRNLMDLAKLTLFLTVLLVFAYYSFKLEKRSKRRFLPK